MWLGKWPRKRIVRFELGSKDRCTENFQAEFWETRGNIRKNIDNNMTLNRYSLTLPFFLIYKIYKGKKKSTCKIGNGMKKSTWLSYTIWTVFLVFQFLVHKILIFRVRFLIKHPKIKDTDFFSLFFKILLLEYNCFTILC